MAITYPLAHPSTPGPMRVELIPRVLAGRTVGQFGGQQQVQDWGGEWWEARVSLPPMARATAAAWIGWLAAMRGIVGTTHFGDVTSNAARGTATGTPVISGAHAAGVKTLATSGWTINITGILKAGDYIQVGSGSTKRLHIVKVDCNSDAGGLATVEIFPCVRAEGLAGAAAITVASCKGTFRLAKNETSWSIDVAKMYGIGFDLIEAI